MRTFTADDRINGETIPDGVLDSLTITADLGRDGAGASVELVGEENYLMGLLAADGPIEFFVWGWYFQANFTAFDLDAVVTRRGRRSVVRGEADGRVVNLKPFLSALRRDLRDPSTEP